MKSKFDLAIGRAFRRMAKVTHREEGRTPAHRCSLDRYASSQLQEHGRTAISEAVNARIRQAAGGPARPGHAGDALDRVGTDPVRRDCCAAWILNTARLRQLHTASPLVGTHQVEMACRGIEPSGVIVSL
jgi:hypothetical protein